MPGYHWLTTAPNPASHRGTPFWNEWDQGQRGWRLHAVPGDEDATFTQSRFEPSVCGIIPRHGWDLDAFVEDRCVRCAKRLGLPETYAEQTRRLSRAEQRQHVRSTESRKTEKVGAAD